LAEQVAQSGVRQIQGDIIGDDTRFVWQGYGVGWSAEDPTWGYGAPASALSINDNVVRVRVLPGSALGQLARVDLRPEINYYSLDNRVRTAQSRAVAQGLQVQRDPGSRTISLWGEIAIRSTGREIELAIDDPALFAAMALKAELLRLGVEVTGDARARHAYPHEFTSLKLGAAKPRVYAKTLATAQSQPLSTTLPIVNKVSQNLHAEMLLRELGFKSRGVGSFEAGLEEVKSFLLSAGLKPWDFDLTDASGLSRQDLVTPSGMVQLLRHMWRSPNRETYAQSLSLAGEDGTLDWRFSRSPARGRIRAKTGTLTNITALSGYATAADGKVLAFSILANNFSAPVSYIRKLVDEICVEMIKGRSSDVSGALQPAKQGQP
jgi:D-alanyl-D-alanine carboxypeptidase/D-alanyl-D-alanine-endopeptidase (penicillin-binding protein 4)